MADDDQLQDLDASIALSTEVQSASHAGDIAKCKELIDRGALAWVQDDIGWSALHFAADARNPQLVQYLLRHGAVWNLVDNLGFTAGDIAYSLNDQEIYRMIVMEGVRAEMLKAVLEAQSSSSSNDDDDAEMEEDADQEEAVEIVDEEQDETVQAGPSTASDNKAFLSSKLRFEGSAEKGDERCIDSEGNGVMMGWELPIMVETARLLCSHHPSHDQEDGLSVLNVGFGLGLVDQELQKYKPKRHVIIEPHPDVLQHARSKGWYEIAGVEIYEGTWQEYLKAFEQGEVQAEFDAIYFDTFSEHYKDLHSFFDALPNLLKDDSSLFSFFHGLGATSQTFYDVYTEVSELHLREIGLKTGWYEVSMLDKGEITWEGVRRRYWNIPGVYRLPICKLEF